VPNDRVNFTNSAAERIARTVRIVEQGNRDAAGLRFQRVVDPPGKVFRVCTFTGSWGKMSLKEVTYKYVTNTPNTVLATNLFANISASTSTALTLNCAIAKEGTAWFLIAAEC
jgi:hypothetical protein